MDAHESTELGTDPARRSDDADLARAEGDRVEARARLHARLFAEPEAGREFGRYRLIEAVGRGGLGAVYRALDSKLGREVAIKLLHERALNRPVRARRQLLAEAALMARLAHPNVVRVYDLGEHEGELFVAMELIKGQTLRSWQKRGRSWRELVEVYLAAGAGLAAAHEAGLVHGDFKPDNVLIGDDGRVLVTDFAVTRHMLEARLELELDRTHADTSAYSGGSASGSSSDATTSSMLLPLVMGTPAYMAPEQFDGRVADAKTDQFAFCVAMWEALAGERPFPGRSWRQLREAIGKGPRPAARRSGPRALWAAIERGMAVAPSERWPSLAALLTRLRSIQTRPRRFALLAGGTGLTALGFVAAIPAMQGAVEATTVPVVQQCAPDVAEAELATLWSSEHRRGIEAAFVATELPYAKAAAETTLARLDAWTQAWKAARVEACTSTDAASRVRLICLDRDIASFNELVSVLSEADLATVPAAGRLVDSLPVVDACDEFELPRGEAGLDPARLDALTRLDARLHRAEMLQILSRTGEGRTIVDEVLVEAEQHGLVGPDGPKGFDQLLGRAHVSRAYFLLDANEQDAALDEFIVGALAARRSEQPEIEAQAWLGMAEATNRVNGAGAERWLDIAELPVELADRPELRAELATLRGLAAMSAGKPKQARDLLLLAVEQHRYEGKPDRTIAALHNLGAALYGLDELELAYQTLTEAVALSEEHWPVGYPDAGLIHTSLAAVQRARGDLQSAYVEYQKANEMLALGYGPEHSFTLTARYQLARVEAELGRCDDARRTFDNMLPKLRDNPAQASLLPFVLAHRAHLCEQVDAESAALSQESVARAREVFPADSTDLASMLAMHGWVLLDLERYAEAEAAFSEARPIFEAELPETHIKRVDMLGGLGAALAGRGRAEQARPLLEQAIAGLAERKPQREARLEAVLAKLDPPASPSKIAAP